MQKTGTLKKFKSTLVKSEYKWCIVCQNAHEYYEIELGAPRMQEISICPACLNEFKDFIENIEAETSEVKEIGIIQ